jgi:hypothetical protein
MMMMMMMKKKIGGSKTRCDFVAPGKNVQTGTLLFLARVLYLGTRCICPRTQYFRNQYTN